MHDLVESAATLRPAVRMKQQFRAGGCQVVSRSHAAVLLAHVFQHQAEAEITRCAGLHNLRHRQLSHARKIDSRQLI